MRAERPRPADARARTRQAPGMALRLAVIGLLSAVALVNRADEARPQSTSLLAWNLNPTFRDSNLAFTPPRGASKIELVPRKDK